MYAKPTVDTAKTVINWYLPQHQVVENQDGEGFTVKHIGSVVRFDSVDDFIWKVKASLSKNVGDLQEAVVSLCTEPESEGVA